MRDHPESEMWSSSHEIARDVWSLLAAIIGGLLARGVFGTAIKQQEETAPGTQPAIPGSLPWWGLIAVVVLTGLVLLAWTIVGGARLEPEVWAASTYLLTWWMFGLTALGAILGRGCRRAFWIGATSMGAAFMILLFDQPDYHDNLVFAPSFRIVEALRPGFDILVDRFSGNPNHTAAKNSHLDRVRRPVNMQYDAGTTLNELIESIRARSRHPDGSAFLIYVDPIGLQVVEKSMSSELARIDLDGVPLGTGLRLYLKQLGLEYIVKDGLLLITSPDEMDALWMTQHGDPFQIVGHCLLALIAAGLGGIAAPLVLALAGQKQ